MSSLIEQLTSDELVKEFEFIVKKAQHYKISSEYPYKDKLENELLKRLNYNAEKIAQ